MCKAKIVHFSVVIIVCDMEMLLISTSISAKYQGDLGQGHFG